MRRGIHMTSRPGCHEDLCNSTLIPQQFKTDRTLETNSFIFASFPFPYLPPVRPPSLRFSTHFHHLRLVNCSRQTRKRGVFPTKTRLLHGNVNPHHFKETESILVDNVGGFCSLPTEPPRRSAFASDVPTKSARCGRRPFEIAVSQFPLRFEANVQCAGLRQLLVKHML